MAKRKKAAKRVARTKPKARKPNPSRSKSSASRKKTSHRALLNYIRSPRKESFQLPRHHAHPNFSSASLPLQEEPLDLSRHTMHHEAHTQVKKKQFPAIVAALSGGIIVTAVLSYFLVSFISLDMMLAAALALPLLVSSTIFFYSLLEGHQ